MTIRIGETPKDGVGLKLLSTLNDGEQDVLPTDHHVARWLIDYANEAAEERLNGRPGKRPVYLTVDIDGTRTTSMLHSFAVTKASGDWLMRLKWINHLEQAA